jgi:gamma-glutamylaminecyclotransferase
MKHLLFVYGTLKRGYSRQALLTEQKFLGIACTSREYAIYHYAGYPAMIQADSYSCKKVFGELYEVSDEWIPALDRAEGVNSGLFLRQKIRLQDINLVQLTNNQYVWECIQKQEAIAYIFLGDLSGAKLVESVNESQLWTM